MKVLNKIRTAIFSIYHEKEISGTEFSGKVIISNLNGDFINGFRVDNGYIISYFTKKNNYNSTYKTIDLEEVIIPARIKAANTHTAFIFPGETPGSNLDDYTWNPDYIGAGGAGSESLTSNITNTIEDQIDDSKLDPCTKGVMEELKNTTNYDIAKVLAKLGADGSVYNTTMISAVAPSGKLAQTIRTSAYNYNIYISTDYEDKTKLFIAASMLHELIHVYFMSIVDDYNSNPNNQNIYNLQSLPSLYQAFCDKKYPPTGQTSPNAHHADMVILYVDVITSAIKEYAIATGTLSSLPNLDQIYNDMAWGGLIVTPVFDDTNTPLTPNDRIRIANRYEAEQRSLSIGDIPNTQNPISQPCN